MKEELRSHRIFLDGTNIFVTANVFTGTTQQIFSEKITPDSGGWFTFKQLTDAMAKVKEEASGSIIPPS